MHLTSTNVISDSPDRKLGEEEVCRGIADIARKENVRIVLEDSLHPLLAIFQLDLILVFSAACLFFLILLWLEITVSSVILSCKLNFKLNPIFIYLLRLKCVF